MDTDQKKISSLLTIICLIVIVICAIIIFGVYMNKKWERMRDIRRRSDVAQVKKALEYHKFEFNSLPDNQTDGQWDVSYDAVNGRQALFKELQSKGIVSNIFDPKNNSKYYYRYHKFDNGEYGCSGEYAIFQVMNFEGSNLSGHGEGSCPERDFASETPNGYTLQFWVD